jgi:hypothetical protein
MTDGIAADTALNLRAGEWVQVRSAEEILATLDADQALDGLPFMPEMLQYCGKRLRVYKSAHKTCDTIASYLIRRMDRAVHLENVRCDGTGHDECQAACLIYWKEAWLQRVPDDQSTTATTAQPRSTPKADTEAKLALLHRATRVNLQPSGPVRYRCQATDLVRATSAVKRRERWSPGFYLKDLTSGNVSPVAFAWAGARAVFNAFAERWLGGRFPRIRGLATSDAAGLALNLQAGDLVEVRSKAEIMQTLSPQQRTKGLWFDVEMLPYCGSTFRVRSRVEKIVDEKTGRMLRLPTASLILEGVVCSGCRSANRMFCSRAIYPYWREAWLKRVERTG